MKRPARSSRGNPMYDQTNRRKVTTERKNKNEERIQYSDANRGQMPLAQTVAVGSLSVHSTGYNR